MARTSTKKIMLRAFRIENPNVSEAHSNILSYLQQVLTDQSTAGNRRLRLNEQDFDEDLLSNFEWRQSCNNLFGMMLRIIPAENGGVIDSELFEQNKITITEVIAGNPAQSQYKDHFYFALNNEHLVTNLPGNINIMRLQTYLNWLLGPVREERHFQFTELTKVPDGVELSKIDRIEFVGAGTTISAQPTNNEDSSFSSRFIDLTGDLLSQVLSDTSSLDSIRNGQLIEAKLFLKIKKKPREMALEEYQRVLGAIVTNTTNDNGIVLVTKDKNRYTGDNIKVKKEVEVERTTSGNRIVEEQLKQEMEIFLNELRAQNNG